MIYAIISVTIASVGQAILKSSLDNLNLTDCELGLSFVFKVFTSWPVLLGLSCYGISAVLWLYALSRCSLSKIYPLTSLSFVFVILMARYILGEAISLHQSAGMALIMLGLIVGSILK